MHLYKKSRLQTADILRNSVFHGLLVHSTKINISIVTGLVTRSSWLDGGNDGECGPGGQVGGTHVWIGIARVP